MQKQHALIPLCGIRGKLIGMFLLFAACCLAMPWTPGLAFVKQEQLPQKGDVSLLDLTCLECERDSLAGVGLGLGCTQYANVYGVQIAGGFAECTNSLFGVQCALLSNSKEMTGIQVGLITGITNARGVIETGLLNFGACDFGKRLSSDLFCLQLGVANFSESALLQTGVVNNGGVLDIGLFNINDDGIAIGLFNWGRGINLGFLNFGDGNIPTPLIGW